VHHLYNKEICTVRMHTFRKIKDILVVRAT